MLQNSVNSKGSRTNRFFKLKSKRSLTINRYLIAISPEDCFIINKDCFCADSSSKNSHT